jgi:AcrR family transcriptional regulator
MALMHDPTAGAAPSMTTRTAPRQRRSRERLDRILWAAGELVDEQGTDRLSLDEVARRAGTSVGSVYRFVANREELLVLLAGAISAAALEGLQQIHSAEEAKLSAGQIARDTIERFLAFISSHPGAKGLVLNTARLPEAARDALGSSDEWQARIERFLGFYAPQLKPARRRTAAWLILTVTGTALTMEPMWAPRTRRSALTELELMISAYLRALSDDESR